MNLRCRNGVGGDVIVEEDFLDEFEGVKDRGKNEESRRLEVERVTEENSVSVFW